MALLTGGEDVGFRETGRGIGRRQYVVMTVTVVTGGDIGGDVGFAERHGFAVIGVAIMFEAVLVAFAAALVAHHFEVAVLRGLDFVGVVAVGANRAAFVTDRKQLAMHAL